MKATKFTVINKTEYNTGELRQVIGLALRMIEREETGRPGPDFWRLEFEVVYGRGCAASGFAYLNGFYSRLRLQKPDEGKAWRSPTEPITRGQLFNIAWHEAMHLWGYHHNQYPTWPDQGKMEQVVARSSEPVGLKKAVVRPRPTAADRQMVRYTAIQARIKAWEIKERRAKGYLKRLRGQAKGYEDRMRAAGRLS